MPSFNGTYVARVNSDNPLTAIIPQVFQSTAVPLDKWTGTRPAVSNEGFVIFINGEPEWPVWIGAQSTGAPTIVTEQGDILNEFLPGGFANISTEVWVGDDQPPGGQCASYVIWYDTNDAAMKIKVDGVWTGTENKKVLAYAETTTQQSGLSATSVELTSLNVTFTAAATGTRWYRASCGVEFVPSAASTAVILLKDGATNIQQGQAYQHIAGNGVAVYCARTWKPTAGVHTIRAWGQLTGGGSTYTLGGQAPAYIMVEDLGPV